ncbi:16S rRNA (cytidine(1402)-2'-O)-methyltransferase [Bacillus solimangrovi]|uniref:Ribosomal RNA small subunit methyltransferase I n=1 Tax=Bacillus solimangrovi TaxID=1305675 RepID=A0A1E5LEW7_9BACI|nr:16S rRNA (cytidine(1402)-2'-O)-methyltransferase [Bacillus solimangrovi]OEH92617.1 16S rRNA (cytidine(1402)-2'-O)-methyltransferase [Bacillus solimangrovi]
MIRQKSFSDQPYGVLYLVATPIGNLEDITYRALRILNEVSMIAAEDTRQTRKLLTHFDIQTPLTSYHEHNKQNSGDKLLTRLEQGESIALVSDAGMPAISDPGNDLVKETIERGIAVIPLPGANAALSALIASGLNTEHFYFYGFLPRKKKEKVTSLERVKNMDGTIIFYESPHRLKETLLALSEVFGNEERVVLAREITKKFEEFLRGPIGEALIWAQEEEIKGEFCILIEGNNQEAEPDYWWESLTLVEHVEYYISDSGLTSKEAIKQVANDRELPKREVYQAYHIES